MDRAERWARAKRETHSLKDWRRGVAVAGLGGVCSVGALWLFGPKDAQLTEALVIGGSIVGAYILRPVAEIAWNYLWAPWRSLTETVAEIATRPKTPAKQDPGAANKRFKAVSARLAVLRAFEGELRGIQRKILKAEERDYSVTGIDGKHPHWDEIAKQGFGGLQDMQALYVELRDCMEALDEVQLYAVSSMGRLTDDDRERLDEAKPILEKALGLVEEEIKRLTALK